MGPGAAAAGDRGGKRTAANAASLRCRSACRPRLRGCGDHLGTLGICRTVRFCRRVSGRGDFSRVTHGRRGPPCIPGNCDTVCCGLDCDATKHRPSGVGNGAVHARELCDRRYFHQGRLCRLRRCHRSARRGGGDPMASTALLAALACCHRCLAGFRRLGGHDTNRFRLFHGSAPRASPDRIRYTHSTLGPRHRVDGSRRDNRTAWYGTGEFSEDRAHQRSRRRVGHVQLRA